MYETFEKLSDSKKNQIIQVCLEEFVENGYKNTSTNTIVKRLGISKGVLFLYFKNKKNLYLYLVEYIMEIVVKDYFGSLEPVINIDIFDNLGEYYKELMQKNPVVFLFMLQAFINTPEELKAEVDARHNKAHDNMFQHMNTVGFRQGIDIRLVDDLLHMVSYYVGQLIFNDLKGKVLTTTNKEEISKNIENYAELFAKYVDILKYGVYERNDLR
ncbi:TetR/AcrR family transcriptional regulator [Clostridium aminobutyricum]|uniref:TetR/AcrR family transcriptional regulator n=1 Tax=Clostridium aminobutyricum TaxID=33953 RepID=A0A939DA87_CLOAM|nr:TetR/AcrR family transcriptional regulator [Clostridium aminobutyricum]MBN7773917.1 TetR/AcrR family transcriptional regulator [Clostridium aminobutyricum]